jgi:hypothetical protein
VTKTHKFLIFVEYNRGLLPRDRGSRQNSAGISGSKR